MGPRRATRDVTTSSSAPGPSSRAAGVELASRAPGVVVRRRDLHVLVDVDVLVHVDVRVLARRLRRMNVLVLVDVDVLVLAHVDVLVDVDVLVHVDGLVLADARTNFTLAARLANHFTVVAGALLARHVPGRPVVNVHVRVDGAEPLGRPLHATPSTGVDARAVPDAAVISPIEAVREKDRLVVIGDHLDAGADLDEIGLFDDHFCLHRLRWRRWWRFNDNRCRRDVDGRRDDARRARQRHRPRRSHPKASKAAEAENPSLMKILPRANIAAHLRSGGAQTDGVRRRSCRISVIGAHDLVMALNKVSAPTLPACRYIPSIARR